MKYCMKYTPELHAQYTSICNADVIEINYRATDRSLPEFLELYKEKEIILNITYEDYDALDNVFINFIKTLVERYPKLMFKVDLVDEELRQLLHELNANYMFIDSPGDLDSLHYFINLGVKAIYLSSILCFNLQDIAEILHDYNGIEIYVAPHIATSYWSSGAPLRKFFIRPEDMFLYEDIIDVCVLFDPYDDQSLTKQTIYYKIYAKDKKWFGDLNEIIVDLNHHIDNRRIPFVFGKRRVNCGKRCLLNHPCSICVRTEELVQVLEENKLILD